MLDSRRETRGAATHDKGSHTLSRRKSLTAAGAVAGSVALAACGPRSKSSSSGSSSSSGASSSGTSSSSKSLHDVTVSRGVPALNRYNCYMSSVPIGQGYYAEEGIQVTNQLLNGGTDAISVMMGGRAQFSAQSLASVFLGVSAKQDLQVVLCDTPKDFTSIAVLADSKYKTFADLKGTTWGTNAIGGDPEIEAEAMCGAQGWVVGKDVKFIAVGIGEPAVHALQTGRIAALALWGPQYVTLTAETGVKFRTFVESPIPSLGFEHGYLCQRTTIEKEPGVCAALVRAQAKSVVFCAAASPTELVKGFYKMYPATTAGMRSATALKTGVAASAGEAPYFDAQERIFHREQKLFDESDAVIDRVLDMLYNAKLVTKKEPASTYFTRQFILDANSIDFEKYIAAGKAYKA